MRIISYAKIHMFFLFFSSLIKSALAACFSLHPFFILPDNLPVARRSFHFSELPLHATGSFSL